MEVNKIYNEDCYTFLPKLLDKSIDDVSITLEDMYANIEFTPFDHLNDMLQEQDDAITGDVILQSVFFKDIIFG